MSKTAAFGPPASAREDKTNFIVTFVALPLHPALVWMAEADNFDASKMLGGTCKADSNSSLDTKVRIW